MYLFLWETIFELCKSHFYKVIRNNALLEKCNHFDFIKLIIFQTFDLFYNSKLNNLNTLNLSNIQTIVTSPLFSMVFICLSLLRRLLLNIKLLLYKKYFHALLVGR